MVKMKAKAKLQYKVAKAFAPASVGNVGVGFDTLGHVMQGVGDTVTAVVTGNSLVMGKVSGCVTSLPEDPAKNTAGKAVIAMLKALEIEQGIELQLDKGIPLGSGMGGSAASAVAAVKAVNALLAVPLTDDELYQYALVGEAVASGAEHGDNIAPSLYGGLILLAGEKQKPVSVNVPSTLYYVCVHSNVKIETKIARKVLPTSLELQEAVTFGRNLAGLLVGCEQSNFELIQASLKDDIIEPTRKAMIPGFDEIKQTALNEGALGCSISGSGPNIFAWVEGKTRAEKVCEAMHSTALKHHKIVNKYIGQVASGGAKILEQK